MFSWTQAVNVCLLRDQLTRRQMVRQKKNTPNS